ncbi:hypothetical protein HOK51_01310 [Candidatus Woesearchaeota archaeon]|jgi:hypothetical protein|nr:hypothetical protein [Candidatus Woesearchaeota archaeon]MBT6518452.1 hypothetical protein [Candidatus Woesearchaeota archaeon]MBT7366933.1 hypothetical protein [Candidatus Woesearchaeota archaeon]
MKDKSGLLWLGLILGTQGLIWSPMIYRYVKNNETVEETVAESTTESKENIEEKVTGEPTEPAQEKSEHNYSEKDRTQNNKPKLDKRYNSGDYTITDVQLGIIPYKHKDEDYLKGVIPFKYITAKNRDETKIFVYVSNDNVRNGVAKLQISESPNGSIITLDIVKKQVDRFHEPIQTKLIKADGTIHSIKYNL